MLLATGFVCLLTAYVAAGFLFAIIFLAAGIGQVDPVAHDASLGVRLILLPGTVALWPVLLRKWMRVDV